MKKTFNSGAHIYYVYKNRKQIFPMLRDAVKGTFKLSFFTMLVIVIALIYLISPIDLLPDFIPIIGWIDDGAIMYLLFLQLKKETARYAVFKAKDNFPIIISKM